MKKLLSLLLLLVLIKPSFAQEGEDVGWVAMFGASGRVEKILHQTYEIDLLVTFFQQKSDACNVSTAQVSELIDQSQIFVHVWPMSKIREQLR